MATSAAGKRYRFDQKLGEGTYGEVYMGFDTLENRTVAIKKIKAGADDQGIASTELREISILNHLDHPNVVKLHNVETQATKILLVFECCDSDLRAVIKKNPMHGRKLKWMLYQLMAGMEHCHHSRVIHRDLKPQNLLVSNNCETLKIADFGLARAFQMPLPAYTHEVVTLWYRAPEILLGDEEYQPSVDIWSCGAIMWEMVTGNALFAGDCEIDVLYMIFRMFGTPTEAIWPGVTSLTDYKPVFPKWQAQTVQQLTQQCPLDSVGMDLMRSMLVMDPERRVSAQQSVNHPWFQEVAVPDHRPTFRASA